jgi:hypothetical protein
LKNPAAVTLARLGGLKGGPARTKTLSKKRRAEIAKNGTRFTLKLYPYVPIILIAI